MGIIHLAPVGRSPGAVTTPLAHLKHVYAEQKSKAQPLPESILGPGLGNPVEGIFLFVSEEVRKGRRKALRTVYNTYGQTKEVEVYGDNQAKVVDVITHFVEKELNAAKPMLFARPVDVNNYEECFQAIAEAALAFGRFNDQGKTLWANLTGGTNVLNAALLEVTFLSGLINALYYIFADEDEQKFLQPTSTDYRLFVRHHWRNIPTIKTTYDERYSQLLLSLSKQKSWDTAQLWRHLSQDFPQLFGGMELELFQKQWLLKMEGREVVSDRARNQTSITDDGETIALRLSDDLFQTLVRPGEFPKVDPRALREKMEREYRLL